MIAEMQARTAELQRRTAGAGVDPALLTDQDSIAVDGAITVPRTFGGRVGDSIVVTDDGYECLTPYPKDLCIV